MSALTFTLKADLKQRVDCSPLTPDLLTGKTSDEIAATVLQSGNRKLRVDEVFAVSGDDASQVVFAGATAKLDFIGKSMASGHISVEGNAGSYLGMQMKGGVIGVSGSVDAYGACELRNGEIRIGGDAGDYLGAALPGNKKGMQGGIVIVKGSVADRCGDHMRRGAILIEGNAGAYLGTRMTAGTIGVLGMVGAYPGYGMRRGTLLLNVPCSIPATFNDCGSHTLGFLPLLLKSFQAYRTEFGSLASSASRVRRYVGDLSGQGKGEILVVI